MKEFLTFQYNCQSINMSFYVVISSKLKPSHLEGEWTLKRLKKLLKHILAEVYEI